MILQVLGGTVNVGSGVLTVRCSAVAADSAVAKVATLVELVSRQIAWNCIIAQNVHKAGMPCVPCNVSKACTVCL